MKSFFDNLVFFIYASTTLPDKHDRKGTFSAIFLISFLAILVLLPIFILVIQKLNLNIISAYLKLPILFRYGIIMLVFITIFRLNYLILDRGNYILSISEKLGHKRERYFSYRWALILFGMLLSGVILLLLRAIKMMG